MISSAVLRHTNGRGDSFQSLIHLRMSFSSATTLLWTPRRISWSVRKANQRSTWLIQLDPVGVKWIWNRGCAASHALIAGVLWVP
jgi:hypothetical protein